MEYTPPLGGAADDPYVDANPATGVEGSAVAAAAVEHPQREIINVLTEAGVVPDSGDLTQLATAIQTLINNSLPSVSANRVFVEAATFAPGVADGEPVYWDNANARFDQAIADGTAAGNALGVADVTGSEVTLYGDHTAGIAGLTPGSRYYLSADTAGGLVDVPPAKSPKIGVAKAAGTLFVDVDAAGGAVGLHTFPVPAEAITPTITGGCGWFARTEVAADRPEIGYVPFDDGVEQVGGVRLAMPKSWDGGPIKVAALWSHGAATAFGVVFGFKAAFLGNDDAHNLAYGAEVLVTDAGGTADDLYATAISGEITPSGTPADSGILDLRVTRKVAEAGDTLDAEARLEQLVVLYNTNAGTDD